MSLPLKPLLQTSADLPCLSSESYAEGSFETLLQLNPPVDVFHFEYDMFPFKSLGANIPIPGRLCAAPQADTGAPIIITKRPSECSTTHT